MKRAAACVLIVAGSCQAQDAAWSGPSGPPGAGGLSGTVGLGVLAAPRYAGADSQRTRALPWVQLRWGDGWFAGLDGLGYRWGDGSHWNAGLRLGFDRGRQESDSPALRGMGDIPMRPELGGFASYRLLPFLSAGAGLKVGSGEDRDGAVADLSLRAMLPVASRVRVMFGLGGHWANQAAMRSAFGVSAGQSAAAGYALYQPGAGWRDWGPSVMAMADLGGSWQLMVRAEQRRLLGDAKASPLVRDANGTSGMVMLGWRF